MLPLLPKTCAFDLVLLSMAMKNCQTIVIVYVDNHFIANNCSVVLSD